MSVWTYVQGIITVEPRGRTQPEKEYCLKTVLEHLPVVAGSEGPMEVYLNQVRGHTTSSNCDEFYNHSNLGDGYKHRMFHVQDTYILTVNGYLRDMDFEETCKEFMKWMNRLSKRVLVKEVVVKITGEENDKVVTNDDNHFTDLYEYDNNWTDYLFWQPPRDEDGRATKGKPDTHIATEKTA